MRNMPIELLELIAGSVRSVRNKRSLRAVSKALKHAVDATLIDGDPRRYRPEADASLTQERGAAYRTFVPGTAPTLTAREVASQLAQGLERMAAALAGGGRAPSSGWRFTTEPALPKPVRLVRFSAFPNLIQLPNGRILAKNIELEISYWETPRGRSADQVRPAHRRIVIFVDPSRDHTFVRLDGQHGGGADRLLLIGLTAFELLGRRHPEYGLRRACVVKREHVYRRTGPEPTIP